MKTATSSQKNLWTANEMNCFLNLVSESLEEQRCIARLIEEPTAEETEQLSHLGLKVN